VTLFEKASHSLVAATCQYEVAALASRGKLPTISALCRKYRWVEGVVLAGLVVHFHYKIKELTCPPTSTDDYPDTSPMV
jgi:hypothetical protein